MPSGVQFTRRTTVHLFHRRIEEISIAQISLLCLKILLLTRQELLSQKGTFTKKQKQHIAISNDSSIYFAQDGQHDCGALRAVAALQRKCKDDSAEFKLRGKQDETGGLVCLQLWRKVRFISIFLNDVRYCKVAS